MFAPLEVFGAPAARVVVLGLETLTGFIVGAIDHRLFDRIGHGTLLIETEPDRLSSDSVALDRTADEAGDDEERHDTEDESRQPHLPRHGPLAQAPSDDRSQH